MWQKGKSQLCVPACPAEEFLQERENAKRLKLLLSPAEEFLQGASAEGSWTLLLPHSWSQPAAPRLFSVPRLQQDPRDPKPLNEVSYLLTPLRPPGNHLGYWRSPPPSSWKIQNILLPGKLILPFEKSSHLKEPQAPSFDKWGQARPLLLSFSPFQAQGFGIWGLHCTRQAHTPTFYIFIFLSAHYLRALPTSPNLHCQFSKSSSYDFCPWNISTVWLSSLIKHYYFDNLYLECIWHVENT